MSQQKDREALVYHLENAADNIVRVPHSELRMLLRRAGLRLRNLPSSDDADRELDAFLKEITDHDSRAP